MDVEMNALLHNQTWELVPRPPGTNIVGLKWIYCTKYLVDGSIDRHKAKLVAHSFTHLPGFNFTHTFTHVIKAVLDNYFFGCHQSMVSTST